MGGRRRGDDETVVRKRVSEEVYETRTLLEQRRRDDHEHTCVSGNRVITTPLTWDDGTGNGRSGGGVGAEYDPVVT